MYELIPVGARTYYIDSPTKIGIYRLNEHEVCVIDTGIDGSVAKKILKILDAQGWELKLILNTHSHADHVGGNALLQERTGCPAFAFGAEAPFVTQPVMEPMVLFGAAPYREIRNKFLCAHPSQCQSLREEDLPSGITYTTLFGHAFQMVGYRTDDDVWFVADAVLSLEALEKHHVSYTYSVSDYLASLDKLETLTGRLFIPSHAEPTDDLHALIEANRKNAEENLALILDICKTPHTSEEIIAAVFTHYQMKMVHTQYATAGSSIRSYLTHLHDEKLLCSEFSQNMLYWKTV